MNGARNKSRNGTGVVLLTLGNEYPLRYTLFIRLKYKMVAVMRKEIGKVGLVVWRAGAVPISV